MQAAANQMPYEAAAQLKSVQFLDEHAEVKHTTVSNQTTKVFDFGSTLVSSSENLLASESTKQNNSKEDEEPYSKALPRKHGGSFALLDPAYDEKIRGMS